MWAIPGAGLCASLLSLVVGRYVLSSIRSRVKAAGDTPEEPIHDPFDRGSITEQRGTVRRKGNPVEVLVTDGEATAEPVRGWVVDRSMGGLCLMLDDEVAPGAALSLKPRNAPPATPWVQVEVRNCKRTKTAYEVGCRFPKTPPWAVLLLFG